MMIRSFAPSACALGAALALAACQSPGGQAPQNADPGVGLRGEPLDQAGQNRLLAARSAPERPRADAAVPGTTLEARVEPPTTSDEGYVQVERLGRPAVNEGLVMTNALSNLFNAVPPTADTTPAAKPIADEVTFVLKAFGNSEARIKTLVTALLPDVMRIDTTIPSRYTATEPTKGIPIGGRPLTEDVMDETLALVLPPGAPAALKTDHVDYGSPDAYGDRHDPPLAEFPYLATPF